MVAVDVVVQRVQVRWSKQSRGFPGAAVRNALPTAFRLPSGHAPEFHDVVLDEDDGFAPQQTVSEPPRHTFGLRLVEEGLRVGAERVRGADPTASTGGVGAPGRMGAVAAQQPVLGRDRDERLALHADDGERGVRLCRE
jgi:hypothetical protein